MIWYGQPDRPPTSEYQSHWRCHTRSFHRGTTRLIAHFHPVVLLVLYKSVDARFQGKVPAEFWAPAVECAAASGAFLKVFTQFIDIGARQSQFGDFMADAIEQPEAAGAPYTLVWKPDHGVWLMTDGSISIDRMKSVIDDAEKV